MLARPEHRYFCGERWNRDVPICTPTYRAPDVLLGSLRFGADLDLWSLGCVAAELHLREPLFRVPGDREDGRNLFLDQCAILGTPAKNTTTRAWMRSLPFFQKFYGSEERALRPPRGGGNAPPEWPPARLRGCPPQLADFVQQALRWRPEERPSAASALCHPFVNPRALSVTVAVEQGKTGLGSIAEGFLEDELLEYLKKCPTWEKLREECRQNDFAPNDCISLKEGQLRMKREFVGYTDANRPPRSRNLNSDSNLQPVRSERVALFAKACRRRAKTWLHQLTARVRAEIRRKELPSEFLRANGGVLLEEDFADNAFVYASVQVLKIGEREDGWHTDGGASLLHAGVTLFGSRTLQVKLEDKGCISLPQRPGSFYVGNLCALEHNVAHGEHAAGSYGEGPPSEQVQITVMLRTDVFRAARARKVNATPGPAELFRIVNTEVAKHLAEEPFHLPDLAAVIAEGRETGKEST